MMRNKGIKGLWLTLKLVNVKFFCDIKYKEQQKHYVFVAHILRYN